MKHIFLNLKRFDIPRELGGVNSISRIRTWGRYVVEHTQEALKTYKDQDTEFVMYLPEAHLIPALEARTSDSPVEIGSQGVFREDTSVGGNFGAFTTNRTANAMRALGCTSVLIGHCEERADKGALIQLGGRADTKAVNQILNAQVKAAAQAGLKILYCIGETAQEQERWQEVLKEQLDIGLQGAEAARITIAYEPVWAIGPGKTPPDAAYITKIARYIKEVYPGADVVYGGGLKKDNAKMLAGIPEIDGGLIALTRFTGEIGFYPEEYLEIIKEYLGN